MRHKSYGFSLTLPDGVTDVVPECRPVCEHVGMHCHDFYEIEVVVSGSGTQVLNGQVCPLSRGSVTLLSPSDFHSVTPHEELLVYNFMFRGSMLSPGMLHRVWTYGGSKFLFFQGDDLQEIISICRLLEWEHKKQSEDRPAFMKNLMECFFMLLLRELYRQPVARYGNINDAVQTSIRYLHQHFRENPSLTQTAAIVSLNPNYFAHRFREEMGITYTAYLTRLKLAQAKKLLLSSSLSVTEVCFASGFTSISNFMKVFKSHTGLSPRQYVQANHPSDP